jgi:hypothetical protein
VNVGFELVEVNALKLSDRNPNSGDIQQIVESIRANGFYSYIVARKGTREVLVGNHRLQAAIQAGMSKVPVIWVEADEKQAAWLLAQDNRLAAFGYRDERTLMELFQEMNGIEGTGYTQADLDDLETWMRRLSPAANPAIWSANPRPMPASPSLSSASRGESKVSPLLTRASTVSSPDSAPT